MYYWLRSIHWANIASTWPTPVNTSFILNVFIEYPVPTNACYVMNFSDPSAAAGDATCHMLGDPTECAFLFPGWSCDVEQINSVSTSTGMTIRIIRLLSVHCNEVYCITYITGTLNVNHTYRAAGSFSPYIYGRNRVSSISNVSNIVITPGVCGFPLVNLKV